MTHRVYWTSKKLAQRLALLEPLVYRKTQALPPFRYQTLARPEDEPPVGVEVDDSQWEQVQPNTYWAGWQTDFILRNDIRIPPDWDAAVPIGIKFRLGVSHDFSHPEALTYIDGKPYAACDRHHNEILLPDHLRDGQSHLIALHGWTGLGGWANNQAHTRLFAETSELVQIDQPTRDFIAVARVTLGIADIIDADQPEQARLLSLLDEAFKQLDLREPFGDAFYASLPQADAYLRGGLKTIGVPLDVDVYATGHAHIDVVWLWTLGQVRRKSGRTFHTVIRLMEQFPDYHFTQSQPQLYDFVRQDYPELFDSIQQRVAEGRWETIGGMWVEADCNLTGNESLARQFLLGRSFFREHFGVESPVLWLPDVFGYAWNLPQLIKEAGLKYFFTIKIGWSQYNRLPYDSFWWQGLDGTRVLTHFSPTPDLFNPKFASTYNAEVAPLQVMGTWTNFRQKDLRGTLETPPTLMSFGYGDGGGGPTREMLENLREFKSFPGAPRVRQASVQSFFEHLEKMGDYLPTWNGELYLEFHRGTYTTQSRNKRANRKSEFLLHDAEFLASYAALMDGSYRYPADSLRQAWELVCLNQFHDIIPGSSIEQAYVESQEQYAHVKALGEKAKKDALSALASFSGGDVVIANPSSFERYDLVELTGIEAGKYLQQMDGTPAEMQPTADGKMLVNPGKLLPFSVTPLRYTTTASRAEEPGTFIVEPHLLENAFVRVELNGDGDITRIYDKANQRDILPTGIIANQWQAFEDRPLENDAWDIDIYYDDKVWFAEPAESIRVLETGPLRAMLEIRRTILHSSFVQRISLVHDSPRIDFDTEIDWREKHILLKTAFPVDVLAPKATYEIQWGNVERPTHRNTSWDWARFETCAQKWVDLSEGGYGISLLNDCKYGHDIHNNVIRLTLLRSPTFPDPTADQGEHRFAYSLLPHVGKWDETTAREAYALNDPLIAYVPLVGRDDANGLGSLLACDDENIIIETIKRAEDGSGLIVRFYEFMRKRGTITLDCRFSIAQAWRTNLIEDNEEEIIVDGNHVHLFVKPYEIISLRLIPNQ